MRIYERVCAVCGASDGVKCYTMSSGAETSVAMLCPKHGKPVDDLIAAGHTGPRRYRAAREQLHDRKSQIVPIEDL